ncbi:MAG: hypothetical protein WCJ49_06675, partial [Deltaproteobacteria bacterium]
LRLDRIIAKNRPCRFCAIAVTLATRTCVRLRDRWVGGLSSATFKSPSAALSLSLHILSVRADKRSDNNDRSGFYFGFLCLEWDDLIMVIP